MIEELIGQENYLEALNLLTDLNDEQTRYLRLVCLIGLKEYQQAKVEGMQAKLSAKETYYDVISMYITAQKELGEFEEAIDLLIEELSMPYIAYQYEMLFNAAYDEILLEKQEALYTVEAKNQIFSTEEIAQILKNKSVNEDLLYMALEQLQQLNIRKIVPSIIEFLRDDDRHPFAKSLIIEMLIEQEVDEDIIVRKFGVDYEINPIFSGYVLEQGSYQGILECLSRALEDDNPSLLAQCSDYLEYVLYALYPKEIYEDEYLHVAGAIHYYIASMQGMEIEMEEIEMTYYSEANDIENWILALKRLEC